MITVRYTWEGDKAQKAVFAAGWEGLARAVVYFHTQLLLVLNVSAKIGRGTTARDYQASAPGQPPRKRTGWLQRHVEYELDERGMRARVGVGAEAIYGAFLELGTRRMRPRPWLLATLEKCLPRMRILATGGKV